MQATAAPIAAPREAPDDGTRFDVMGVLASFRDPLRVLAQIRGDLGDVACKRFFNSRYYLVSEPDAIRRVLVENHRNYHKSRNYAGLKVLLGEGLLTSEGETWKKQRKLAQPAFHHERLAALVTPMVECTRDMLARWQREQLTSGKAFDVHRELTRLTFRIVGRTLLSAEVDGDAKVFGDALNTGLHWANAYAESLVRIPLSVPTPSNLRMRKVLSTVDGVLMRMITERRRQADPPHDLLSMLMDVREDGEGMSDQRLRDELLTLVLAGHETTANSMAFTFFLLAKNPSIRARLEAEVADVLGDRDPTLADLPKLEYTRRVIEESMRLYPPAWIVEREALGEDVVGGFRVHKGATIGICSYVNHRHPRFWKDPEVFDPDRFLPEAVAARPKHLYLPFGGGPRTCIGNAFAMMEAQVLLAMITQKVRLEAQAGFVLELDPSITLRPTKGVWVGARARG